MSCSATIKQSAVTELLRAKVGKNDNLFSQYTSEVFAGNTFNEAFTEWYESKFSSTPNIKTRSKKEAASLVEAIERYHNELSPSVAYSSKLKQDVTEIERFGYSSIGARETAAKICADFIVNFYHQQLHDLHESEDLAEGQSRKSYYADAVLGRIEYILAQRVMSLTGKTEDEVYDILDSETPVLTLETLMEEASMQDKNVLALYKEMLSNRVAFFNKVFLDSRLGELRFTPDEQVSEERGNQKSVAQTSIEEQDDISSDENTPVDEDSSTSEETSTVDHSIEQMNSHDGLYRDFQMHISSSVRAYLSSLKKLKSPVKDQNGNYAYNEDNDLGIAECMDVNECCAILYSTADCTSLESFIDSIRQIGERIPGFEAFGAMADYLKENLDFACEMRCTFGKFIISKAILNASGNTASTAISNLKADKQSSLVFEYIASAKATSVMLDDVSSTGLLNSLNKQIADYKKYQIDVQKVNKDGKLSAEQQALLYAESDKQLNDILVPLVNIIKRYFPTISESSIQAYVKLANNKNSAQNLTNLANIIKDTIIGGYETQQNYHSRIVAIAKAKKDTTAEKQETLQKLYSEDYISSKSQMAAINLAKELLNYSVVQVDLNSRNIHGKLASDVINDSMITNIMTTLKSNTALANYGKYKGQSRQYDFSNIMIEHVDPKTKQVINYGLFTQDSVTGELTPTSYASRLLRARLLNGATNTLTEQSVLYSEMSRGDYIATGYLSYFSANEQVVDTVATSGPQIFANYLMRTPSDASKNFVMMLPRYETRDVKNNNTGLFRITNSPELTKKINQFFSNLPILENTTDSVLIPGKQVTMTNAVARIVGTNNKLVYINDKDINEKNTKTGDNVTVTYCVKEGNDVVLQYRLSGTRQMQNGHLILANPKLDGIYNYEEGEPIAQQAKAALENAYRQKLDNNGEVKRALNVNHPVYKQVRNVFMQELTSMAIALDKIFVCENGYIVTDSEGNFKFHEGMADNEATRRRLYQGYHVGKGKHIVENDKLTGSVFSSNKFTITETDEQGNVVEHNYGQQILEKAFNLLYGKPTDSHLHVNKDTSGVHVYLTEAQEAVVQEQLTEFMTKLVDNTNARLEQYKDFIHTDMSRDNVADFALNYYLAYVGFDDIFEGDSKFYKSTQDFLKRAKEVQGSGVPYGIANYNMDLNAPREVIDSRLNTKTFTRKKADGTTETVEIKQYNKFRGVTIKNTILSPKETAAAGFDGATEDGALTKKLIASGVPADMARQIMSGHHNTKTNDAQSYITFDEWVRRIAARGQLEENMPLIEALLDETKPIDPETLKTFVQVQKNFYYDQYFNPEWGIIVPRQIKNAEFVLLPRLIKGTQLEQVYDLMQKHGIDQLNTEETSKAAKANVLTLWDNNGQLTDANVADFEQNVTGAVELYNYNYLYTQQETQQHIAAKNKAGLQIMKKILDNIPEDSPLFSKKQEFFDLFTTNIDESFVDLMDDLKVPVDKSGNIVVNQLGQIEGLNYKIFFDKLLQEALRLGVDSNMLDYLTLEEGQSLEMLSAGTVPVTKMPMSMSLVASKLENIAQSIFNSSITRQMLPGFHAAQITSVGWSAKNEPVTYKLNAAGKGKGKAETLTVEEYNALDKKNQMYYTKTKGEVATDPALRYHPNGKPYIEVMLPKNNFNFNRKKKDGTLKTDAELLKELQDAGCDEIIGYRIPTEGKQSVAILKVVGFTDDALGSTIVVPDGWVSQTGSDFDIDSVYGIHFNARANFITGKLEADKYQNEYSQQQYFQYIKHRLDHKLKGLKVSKSIEELKKAIDTARDEQWTALMKAESESYHNLSDNVRAVVKKAQSDFVKTSEANKTNYLGQSNAVVSALTAYKETQQLSETELTEIDSYIERRNQLIEFVTNSTKEDQVKYAKGKADILTERLSNVETEAKNQGLPTYEEFCKMPAEERNERNARCNRMLNIMLDILKDPSMLEENVSQSEFQEIITQRDKSIDTNVLKERSYRSPYNFLDQAAYQEDAMSGLKLKGISVARDSFTSVCNTVHPRISADYAVKIQYLERDGYDLEQLENAFTNVEVEGTKGNRIFTVTHNTFGWTKNNHNVGGKILTMYSSKTTAHILDAIKEGNIPNVNDLTFGVYKCFPDVGSDYATAVAFIMQPGVTRIVEAYNKNKSIYATSYRNPVNSALIDIAKELCELEGVEVKGKFGLNEALDALQAYNEDLAQMFNASDSEFKIELSNKQISKLTIDSKRLVNRLKTQGIFIDKQKQLLFDLGTILQYYKLSNLSADVTKYSMVCNPDKFGAKQSIFATNRTFNDAMTYAAEPEPTLYCETSDGKTQSVVAAIYPGIQENLSGYASHSYVRSAYPSLDRFMKRATASSILINQMLFETQQRGFIAIVNGISQTFTGDNKKLDEQTAKDFQNYIINSIYQKLDVIRNRISWDTVTNSFVTVSPYYDASVKSDIDLGEVKYTAEDEFRRIYGYGKSVDLLVTDKNGQTKRFDVADINNVTSEEIEEFITLSPAQKVFWIQKTFTNQGVFKYINVNLFNSNQNKRYVRQQTMTFNDSCNNLEEVYRAFNESFYNNNPLVALATLDLIKYAFVAEGFRMKHNAISKIISNRPLMDSTAGQGTGLVAEFRNRIKTITDANNDAINEQYVRSHYEQMSQIAKHYVERNEKKQFELARTSYGIIHINNMDAAQFALAEKYDMFYRNQKDQPVPNKYVVLRFGNKSTLYKIVSNETQRDYFLYPLNKLEAYENSQWSANITNNTFDDSSFYRDLIQEWQNVAARETSTNADVVALLKSKQEAATEHRWKNPNAKSNSTLALEFDINAKNQAETGGFEDVIRKVTDHFSEKVIEPLYVTSNALTKYITHTGVVNGSIQTINGQNYIIRKTDFSTYNRRYIGLKNANHEIKENNPQIVEIMERARRNGYNVNNAFIIEPLRAVPTEEMAETEPIEDDTSTRQSSVTELGVRSMRTMYRRQMSENDKNAERALKRLHDKDIMAKTSDVEIHLDDVIPITAEYVTTTTDALINDLTYFKKDEEGVYRSVTDPYVIDLIRNDRAERDRFLKTLLDARAFVKNYSIIKELNISAEDPALHNALTKIKNAIDTLEHAQVITKAEDIFAENVLSKLSDNPNIKGDYASILDGYHSASAFDAWINDLQETSNPLLQVVTKEVMGDIRGYELAALSRAREFKAALNTIKEAAKAAGVKIDYSHIIDDYGKFIESYNQAFIDKIEELRSARDTAKIEYGEGSIEHLKAKFEYDRFKLSHVNQQVADNYYLHKLEMEDYMLKSHPTIYSAYQKLLVRQREILAHKVNGALPIEYQNELKEVKAEISTLMSPAYFNQTTQEWEEKPSFDDPHNPFTGEAKRLMSSNAAFALRDFVVNMRKLNEKYFTKDAVFGFEETLEKKLDIIRSYELRAFGRPTVPITQLMDHPDYVEAKQWLLENAEFVLAQPIKEKIDKAFAVLREDSQKITGHSKKRVVRRLSILAKQKDAYDENGVIDGTKFTDEEIAQILEDDMAKYSLLENVAYSDRSLISNGGSNAVFTFDFYNKMKINGLSNPEFLKIVREINSVLAKYLDSHGVLNTQDFSEADIDKLIPLYDQIEELKATIGGTNKYAVRIYMARNTEVHINEEAYETQRRMAQTRGANYYAKWCRLCQRVEFEDEEDTIGTTVPNRRIFGCLVPKGYKQDGTGDNSKVDKRKTEAIRIIRENTRTVRTQYYYEKVKEMHAKGKEAFDEWWNKNHVYNPNTHTFEPISCWTHLELNDESEDAMDSGCWTPKFNQTTRRVKNGKNNKGEVDGSDDFTNHNFKEGYSTAQNYKAAPTFLEETDEFGIPLGVEESSLIDKTDYSNTSIQANEYEQQVKALFQETLAKFAVTPIAKNFLRKGYMASRSANHQTNVPKELVKLLGWIDSATGKEAWYNDVDYANDQTPAMPMMELLSSKDSVEVNYKTPIKKENESEEDYKKRLLEFEEAKKKAIAHNLEVHKALLDKDWESVMEEFISKAAHYNAIQNNKYMLFYAKNMLDRMRVFVKNEGFNDLQKDSINSSDEETQYSTKLDTRLQEQYVNWIRRLVYDQWKKPNNHLTRTANILQSLTSAKFMMLNVTGGIANVTVGDANIFGETFAKDYVGWQYWAQGRAIWTQSIPSQMADMYSEKASSKQSAIIKAMNVIDFDEITGSVHVPNASEYISRARDLMFSPQAMGENLMQNGMMFSMMLSHRLYKNTNQEENGKTSWILMNEAEAIRHAHEAALQQVLTEELYNKWEQFIKHETKDANTKKEYMWFRKNFATEFANLYLNNEQKREFIKLRKQYEKEARDAFNNDAEHPTLYSQLALGSDGKLDFAKESVFSTLGDEAWNILGAFKGRVISVNKKIHGVYDRLGAAQIESEWWGSLVMQYHKHIYPGIMKRWRRQGYFNEERGSIEKGCYASLKDFLALPLHKKAYTDKLKAENGMNDAQVTTLKGIQNMFSNYVEFFTHISLNWNMLPSSERGNIKRALGDIVGVMAGIMLAIALQVWKDDNDEESLMYNLAMYEADRLVSESFMYNPFGLASEAKKLWSSPIAVQSGIEDILHSMSVATQYILQGEDFDPYYKTGLFAGEHKIEVMLKRQIPMYHAIQMLTRLQKNNKYYKLGDNMLSIVPVKDIANFIKE